MRRITRPGAVFKPRGSPFAETPSPISEALNFHLVKCFFLVLKGIDFTMDIFVHFVSIGVD